MLTQHPYSWFARKYGKPFDTGFTGENYGKQIIQIPFVYMKEPFATRYIYSKRIWFQTTELFIDILLCQWVGTGGKLERDLCTFLSYWWNTQCLYIEPGINSCLLENFGLSVQVNSFIRCVRHTNIKHCWLTYLHTRNFGPLSKTQFIYSWTIFMTYTTLANIIQWYWHNIVLNKYKI